MLGSRGFSSHMEHWLYRNERGILHMCHGRTLSYREGRKHTIPPLGHAPSSTVLPDKMDEIAYCSGIHTYLYKYIYIYYAVMYVCMCICIYMYIMYISLALSISLPPSLPPSLPHSLCMARGCGSARSATGSPWDATAERSAARSPGRAKFAGRSLAGTSVFAFVTAQMYKTRWLLVDGIGISAKVIGAGVAPVTYLRFAES